MESIKARLQALTEKHPRWITWVGASALAAALFGVFVAVALQGFSQVEVAQEDGPGAQPGVMEQASNGAAPGNAAAVGGASAGEEAAGAAPGGAIGGAVTNGDAGAEGAGQQGETPSQANAFMAAKLRMAEMPYSRDGLIAALQSDGYSPEDAAYAADKLNVNWTEKATEMAQQYLDTMEFTREDLIDQLQYEGFSREEAEAAVDATLG